VHWNLLTTVLVAGVVQAGLYGLLPVSIILSYRISRTIAFVHGGIAAACALTYWILSLKNELLPNHLISIGGRTYGHRMEWTPWVAMVVTVVFGGVLGALYGLVIMSQRIARLAILTLTIISLGVMMALIGLFGLLLIDADVVPPSPFGTEVYKIFNVYLTAHKVISLLVVAAVSAALAVWLSRTHTGLVIRALADDQEAGVWCGVKLRATGTIVYAGSGAFAGLAGVLIAVVGGPNPSDMIVLFLRGLAIAVVGGLRSLPLAFLGAFLFGLTETALIVGFFGSVTPAMTEVILSGLLLSIIVIAARLRRDSFFLLERQSL
jgi:branched-subunit amino acid ABC-type transport system permease component